MKRRPVVWIAILTIVLGGALRIGAEETELDPLLKLLVEQGVITLDQARAVQAEYDRRAAGKSQEVQEAPPPSPTVASDQTAGKEPEHWYDKLEIKGDLRLRYEGFDQDESYDDGRRDRFRLRLRPGVYAEVTDRIRVGFQLRSGDRKDPVSDNQSLDNGFSLKEIAISEAFAAFGVTSWFDLTLGRFDAKKKWLVSDMQWDDDVAVEGAIEQLDFGPFEASLYQYVLEESKDAGDAYLFGGQLRTNFELGSDGAITVGAGYDQWERPQLLVDQTLSGELKGNKVTNLLDDDDFLISDFQIYNGFVSWTYWRYPRWPVRFYLFGYHNTGAEGIGKDNDTGYFARLQFGAYKKKGQVMLRYSRYYSEPDATFYVFAQSDTTRASDVDGHRFDLRLGWVARSYINITWYHTKAVFDEVPTMDRWQVDYIIRF